MPNKPEGPFETIYCNYVLNVLEPDKWQAVIDDIKSLLTDTGNAYITVRRDIKKEGWRKHGRGHTYQCNVILPHQSIEKNGAFETYLVKKLG